MKLLRKENSGFVKKFAALILILAMGAIANAALTFTISGPSSLNFGQIGTYIVSYSGLELLAVDVDIPVDKGGIGAGQILVPYDYSSWDIAHAPPPMPPLNLAVSNDISMTDLGSPLFSFYFSAPSSGTIGEVATISLIENSFIDLNWEPVSGAFLNGIQVTLTPEPTTLMLLGLGGLFLRRRQK